MAVSRVIIKTVRIGTAELCGTGRQEPNAPLRGARVRSPQVHLGWLHKRWRHQ